MFPEYEMELHWRLGTVLPLRPKDKWVGDAKKEGRKYG